MCDILSKPCEICGTMLPMHLGDYNTSRKEIMVFCNKCILSSTFNMFYDSEKCIVWDTHTRDYRKILVMSLTDNAWNNREDNCPNTGNAEIYDIKIITDRRNKLVSKYILKMNKMFIKKRKKIEK